MIEPSPLLRAATAAATAACAAIALGACGGDGGSGGSDRPASRDRDAGSSRSLTIAPDREFARGSFVHRPLPDDAPLEPESARYVADLLRQIREHYGHATVNFDSYSPTLSVVDGDQPTVRVRARDPENAGWRFAPLQRKWEAVPLPRDFAPSRGTDQEAIVYQPSTGRYWEFWKMAPTGAKVRDSAGRLVDEWGARWGGRIDDLGSSPGYFEDPSLRWDSGEGIRYGTAATGIALLGGLMTIEEQRRGRIEHVVHLAIPEPRAGQWAFPAHRTDGIVPPSENPHALPEGATLRLPAHLDLDAMDMDPYARMIAKAVQRHGMVIRDRSGAVTLYGENPGARQAESPYHRKGGILRCPEGKYEWECSAASRLEGFPWHRLQVLRMQLSG